MFAEFLLLLLIFPWLHSCVGLTIGLIGCSLVGCFYLVVNYQRASVSVISLCKEKIILVTHISIISSMVQ